MNFHLPILAALAPGATATLAEPPPGPPPGMHGPNIEKLTKDLSLSEAQQPGVKRIFDEQRAKRDAERQQFESSGTRPTREEMYARHEQADAELHEQPASVLGSEQLTKFGGLRKRQRPPGPPPGEDGGPPPR